MKTDWFKKNIQWFLMPGLMLAGIALSFDVLFVNGGSCLAGEPDLTAGHLWHLWWPQFSLRVPDTMAINTYSGGPFLANHLGYLPILQSFLFAGLNGVLKNPVQTLNLVLIGSQLATHFLVYRFLAGKEIPIPVAALGATAFVWSPWYYRAISQSDIILAWVWLMPLSLMLWDLWLEHPSLLRSGLLVVGLYAAVLSGVQHIAWIVGLWLPYAVWTYSKRVMTLEDEQVDLARDRLPFVAITLLILFLIYPMPNLMRTLLGNEPAFAGQFQTTKSIVGLLVGTAPAVWLLGAAALAGIHQRKKSIFWGILGLCCLIVAVGLLPEPVRMVAGALGVTWIPLYHHDIFAGLAMLALITFACQNWHSIRDYLTRPWWPWLAGGGAILLVLVTFPGLLKPLDVRAVSVPSFYEVMGAEPEDYYVLTYPFGMVGAVNDQSGDDRPVFPAQSAVWHHKRTVSGLAPYYEPDVHQVFEEMLFLFPESISPGDAANAANALGEAVRLWRIGYVIVYPDLLSTAQIDTIDDLAQRSSALCPARSSEGMVYYRARWQPGGCEPE